VPDGQTKTRETEGQANKFVEQDKKQAMLKLGLGDQQVEHTAQRVLLVVHHGVVRGDLMPASVRSRQVFPCLGVWTTNLECLDKLVVELLGLVLKVPQGEMPISDARSQQWLFMERPAKCLSTTTNTHEQTEREHT
jgi:hypothetical protein